MVAAFSKEKNPSRSLLCDCTTSNFAKVRFKLYCWCWLPSLYFIQEHRPEKILIRLAPANWSQQQINCFKSKTIFNANFTFHMLLLFDMMKLVSPREITIITRVHCTVNLLPGPSFCHWNIYQSIFWWLFFRVANGQQHSQKKKLRWIIISLK